MRGKLYLVGTPIGNLNDMTYRAVETLKTADVIACEDTRHTLALLNVFGIKRPLISYYKQKEREGSEKIKELLDEGKTVALVTDAGMPCISDPGSVLVKKLLDEGYEYAVVPGPTAVTSAAALCGCENGFCFVGFLPEKNKDRQAVLDEVAHLRRNVVFYAAPHDVNDVLSLLGSAWGERTVYVVKEITKIYESVQKGLLSTTRVEDPKGEYVLVVEPEQNSIAPSDEELVAEVRRLMSEENTDRKTAAKIVADRFSVSKNELYKKSLED